MIDPDVIAPNLNRRLSGVSATVFGLVPLQAKKISIVATGVGLPESIQSLPLWRVPFLPRRTRVWHARRNNEMLIGILLKFVFRSKLKLVFTSSSPRERGGLTRWLVSKMDGIVATNDINATVMPGKPTIIPHGVDTEVFTPGESDLFQADGQKLIGCFGRIRHMKGTHHFVEAMCQLLPQHPDFTAIVMGRVTKDNADYAADLQRKIEIAGLTDRILFKPEQPMNKMPSAYRALSIYVAPSLLEGFGLTPLEAMSCGIPTVASRDVGAFNDQIQDGSTGYLVTKDDPAALVNGLSKLLVDKDHLFELSKNARAHIQENFALEREANALAAFYQTLLKNG